MAIMGPSGCGKTTLLNVLAQRKASAKAQVSSVVLLNGKVPSESTFQRLSSYVESDDALIGSLTVKETLYFAAQLSLSRSVSAAERFRRINELLHAFGLTKQANTLIGTLLKKGHLYRPKAATECCFSTNLSAKDIVPRRTYFWTGLGSKLPRYVIHKTGRQNEQADCYCFYTSAIHCDL